MGEPIYKNGVAILVTYQAVNVATGKTVTMAVYDEAHALDEAKGSAGMTEIGATGRYYASFTPDAEGEWIVICKNTSDSNGEVFKAYGVVGHDLDSIGDAIDAGFTAGAKEASLAALATSTEIATLDGVVDAGFVAGAKEASLAALATSAEITTLDGVVDSGFTAGAKEASLAALATSAEITTLDGVIDAGFAAIASPAMVG